MNAEKLVKKSLKSAPGSQKDMQALMMDYRNLGNISLQKTDWLERREKLFERL